MKRAALVCLAAGLLWAGEKGGIRPRDNATDYPGHQAGKGVTIAGAVLAPDEVAKLFATDLNRGGYVVLEVAVFPDDGNQVDLLARDFLLRVGSDPATIRPVSADAIASALQRKNTPKVPPKLPGNVDIYPTSTIGYESGTYNGGQRRGGVYTESGVGVGVGGPHPPSNPRGGSTDVDQSTMRQELQDVGLPEGKTSEVVAGYLYFPKPTNRSAKSSYTLTYYGVEGQVNLVIPPPRKK
jgi:hypothetical protein